MMELNETKKRGKRGIERNLRKQGRDIFSLGRGEG
jgi:hypothetical protein